MKSLSHICIAICLSRLALCPSPAAAASILSVAVQNASVSPNGSGEVLVLVAGAGESINLTGYEFRISPSGSTTSQLQFLEESEAFLGEASYLFAGNSTAASDAAPSSVGTVSTTTLPNDTFIGGDSTNDLANIAVTGSKLLVRLAVKHLTGPSDPLTTAGHTFSIALVPNNGDSSAFTGGSSNTGFVSSAFAGVGFASQPGTVTVVVPEPSTLALVVASLAFFLGGRRRVG